MKKAAKIVGKAFFCFLLSYCLVLLTLGNVMLYLNLSLPIGLLVIPVTIWMFWFFTKLEKSRGSVIVGLRSKK